MFNILMTQECVDSFHYEDLFRQQKKFKLGNNIPIATNAQSLYTICSDTADFLKKIHLSKYVSVSVGVLQKYGVTMQDVIETLDFIAEIAQTNPHLLSDCSFIDTHFTLYRWYAPDSCYKTVIPPGHCTFPECLRVTHYTIAKVHASHHKTHKYYVPLYPIPCDEQGKTPAEIRKHKEGYVRFKFSFPSIVKGALEGRSEVKNPIAWISESEYRDFAMQGSAQLIFPDGLTQHVELGASNGMDGADRYWYSAVVKEYSSKKGKFPKKVRPIPGVSFAGDIEHLGFGKLLCTVGINQKTGKREAHLGVLMDTGFAFKNNPYHVDLFMGYFEHAVHFQAQSKQFPVSAMIFLLIRKNTSAIKV